MSLPSDLQESVAEIIRTEGIKVLTLKDLRARLEAKYKMDLVPHQRDVEEAAKRAMQLPDIQRELAKAKAEKQAGPIGGKGGKKKGSLSAKKTSAKEVKVKKPDDYPKAALSPYIFFVNENRERAKAENPDAKHVEIFARLGEMWQKASEEEKEKYKQLSAQDKVRFEKEMEAYKAGGGAVIKKAGAKVEKTGPKRARNAYMFFISEFREKNPGKVTEVAKAGGAAWEKMTSEEKKRFEDLAAQDKERYKRELESA